MRQKAGHNPDYVFLSCLAILVVFGLVMLSSASSDLGKIKFDDTFYYLKHQISQGLLFGLIGFFAIFFAPYELWKKLAVPLLAISVFLLILVFTPLGFSHTGANRWIDIGITTVQPAEFVKFTLIIYLAAWLSGKKGTETIRQTDWLKGFIPFVLICGFIGFLIVIQPSTTTPAIILAAALIVYFISGSRFSFIITTVLLAIVGLSLLISLQGGYRVERIKTYAKNIFNIEETELDLGKGFHINQALLSIGSGGLFGVGFGESTTKFNYLPEPIGDSIFAVIAEELGFAGASLTIAAFVVLIVRGFLIAKRSRDKFAQLAVIGFASIIAIQTFIHIGAISGVIPLTGVSLPFISYGGTSLAVFLTMAGLIAKISKYT